MSLNESGPLKETGKDRTGRINLDYYKTPDALSRGKGWLSVAAVVGVVAWVSGLGLDARPWSRRSERTLALISPGPLVAAHATWDAECEACHVPFTPIDGSAWTARFVGRAGAGADTHCQSCHDAAGHHDKAAIAGDASSCASCHRDHRGREADLASMADQNCTRCHSALGSHTRPGAGSRVAASVTRFDAEPAHHPEFAIFRGGPNPVDPGRVKFNHAQHMTRGLPATRDGVKLMTLAKLDDDGRRRYRSEGQKDDDGVQLRCDSCHHPEGDRGGAATFKAVRFENDCKTCHPLSFDPELPALRHSLQLAEVDDSLWQIYSARYVRDHPELKSVPPTPRPVPGRAERPENRAARLAVHEKVKNAEKTLFGAGRCGECHHYETAARAEVVELAAWEPSRDVRIVPANVNGVWFKKASFDHSAHSAVTCRTCHSRAYADDPLASKTSRDVMLPTIALCQQCHAPRQSTAGAVTGGAGFSCSECHRYHDVAPAGSGSGSLAGGNEGRSDLKQFLTGAMQKAK